MSLRRNSDHVALVRVRKRPCRSSSSTATMSLRGFRSDFVAVLVSQRPCRSGRSAPRGTSLSVAVRGRRFSAEQRAELWQGTHAEQGPDTLKKFLSESEAIVKRHSQQRKEAKASEWLPLSVWAHRGFDTDRIKQYAPSREDPVLGLVYQVEIATSEIASVQTRDVERRMEKSSSSHGPGGRAQDDDPQPLSLPPPPPEGPPIGGGGEVTEKMLRQQVALAGRILSKLGVVTLPLQVRFSVLFSPCLCSRAATMSLRWLQRPYRRLRFAVPQTNLAQATLKHKLLNRLPEFAITTAKETLSQLQSMEAACKKCARGSAAPLGATLQECNDLVHRWSKEIGGSNAGSQPPQTFLFGALRASHLRHTDKNT